MLNYIKKINQKYISEFKNNIRNGVLSLYRVSDTSYLKVILMEVNKLFKIMSGRQCSRLKIPTNDDFPDSVRFNSMIDDFDIDLEKLYKAQEIINSDVQNVANFNSLERTKIIKSMADVQSKVYSTLVRSRFGMSGNILIRQSFLDSKLPEGSKDVKIDSVRKALTLLPSSSVQDRKSIDKNLVTVSFVDSLKTEYNLFPSNKFFALGSYWKKSNPDPHFGRGMPAQVDKYRTMMVDEGEYGVGTCQFEMVYTNPLSPSNNQFIMNALTEYLSKMLGVDKSMIIMEFFNSLNGNYVGDMPNISTKYLYDPSLRSQLYKLTDIIESPKIKLIIPFIDAPFVSSLLIDFEPNDLNVCPAIDSGASFVFDSDNNRRNIHSINIDSESVSNIGKYIIVFDKIISPRRLELILYYQSPWAEISKYFMSCYKLELNQTISLTTYINGVASKNILSSLNKKKYVLIDYTQVSAKEKKLVSNIIDSKGVL